MNIFHIFNHLSVKFFPSSFPFVVCCFVLFWGGFFKMWGPIFYTVLEHIMNYTVVQFFLISI